MKASLILLRHALLDPDTTHVYLMSGQDYPLKTDADIAAAVGDARHGGNFINIVKMPHPTKRLDRLDQWHFYDFAFGNWKRMAWISRRLPRRNVERLLRGLQPHGGSQWWLLERQVAAAMVEFVESNPWYMNAFRHSSCSDEMFFQTLFAHLGFTADGPCPTATRWPGGNAANPLPITREIYDEMRQDWHFMARKFVDFHPA